MLRVRFCRIIPVLALVLAALFAGPGYRTAFAQTNSAQAAFSAQKTHSPQKALAYSLLLPGLGQRYVNNGHWGGWGTTFALVDVGLWASLFGVSWQENQVEESFRTLAASRAAADIDGKDRTFFLNLATYRSSDDFLDTVLRNRAWDQIGYVEDPSFQWQWATEEDFITFRSQREKAESLGRNRTIIIVALVANRLISGITAAIGAGTSNKTTLSMHVGPPARNSSVPTAHLSLSF